MQHKAKKSLGQNFLKSEPALNMMCQAGRVDNKDIIVEIGPGKGALTSKLLVKAQKVVAIEKDRELIEILKEKFKEEIKNNKLEIIDGDCLDFNPDIYFRNKSYKIIANIPYNITGAIIKKFLSEVKNKPTLMTLLVQKEVANRICASSVQALPGHGRKESILSLSVKAYALPKYMMKVSKRFFSPSPKVDSAIILIDKISNKNFKNGKEEDLFFKIVKSGFAHKRKVLIKNLESLNISKEKIDNVFKKLEIEPKTRAEDLSFSVWLEIFHILSTDI